jgi:SAM-dependent methyltransferase
VSASLPSRRFSVSANGKCRDIAKAELGSRYRQHHLARRDRGEFVFVPERVPLFVAAVGGPGRRVLDLGCRTGAVSRHFLDGNEVVGVDIDQEALKWATERGIDGVWADVEEPLRFPDASFDVVVAGELLEHLRFPDELVREARRLLRPDGVFVGSTPNGYRLKSRLLFLAGRPPERDPTHLHLYSPEALSSLLAGFPSVSLAFVGGRFTRLHPRLLARAMVFVARAPR